MATLPTRQAAPALTWRAPDCSVCGEEVSHDGDCYYCEHCSIYWPNEPDGEGSWHNEEIEQCPSTHQPLALNPYAKGKVYQFITNRCLLDSGHEGKHRVDVITEWTDKTAVNGHGPADAEVTS